MIPLNLSAIQKHLKEKQFDPSEQPETNQIYLIFDLHAQKFPLFIRVIEDSGLLQMLAFMPFNINPNAANDTARFLHLLNKELDVPGFGMDESAHLIFYRVMIPASKGEIDPDIIDAFVVSMKSVCETFFPAIAAVGQGAATYEEVFKKMKEANE